MKWDATDLLWHSQVPGWAQSLSGAIVQWADGNSTNQQWQLVRVG